MSTLGRATAVATLSLLASFTGCRCGGPVTPPVEPPLVGDAGGAEGAGARPDAGSGAAAPAPNSEAFIVLRSGGSSGACLESLWLEDGAAGPRVTARAAAPVFPAGQGLWVFETFPRKVPVTECECAGEAAMDPDKPMPARCPDGKPTQSTEDLAVGRLRDLLSDAPPLWQSASFAGERLSDMLGSGASVSAEPVALIGPYLLVEECTWQYNCGAAHGNTECEVHALDLDRRAPAMLDWSALRAAAPRAAFDAAAQTLATDAEGDEADPNEVAVVGFATRWDAAGVELSLRLVISTCYACGNGEWSSYTSGANLPTRSLAPALQAYAAAPPLVQRWLAGLPAASAGRVLGFRPLTLPPERRDAARAAFAALPQACPPAAPPAPDAGAAASEGAAATERTPPSTDEAKANAAPAPAGPAE